MRTNRINVQFDHAALDKLYTFYQITTEAGHFKRGAAIFDSPAFNHSVEAVCFTEGNSAWLMLPAATNDQKILRAALKNERDDTITFSKQKANQVPDRQLLQLLLCSLANANCEKYRFNNVSGKLLVVHPHHIDHGIGTRAGKTNVIHALEVQLSHNMDVELKVKTFTALALKNYMNEGKMPIGKLPRYELTSLGFMKRHFGKDSEDLFVQRAPKFSRYGKYAFLDISSGSAFESSKLGVLKDVLTSLKMRYGNAVKIEFQEIEDTKRIHCKKRKKEIWRENFAELVPRVQIIDAACDDDSEIAAEKLTEFLGEEMGIEVIPYKGYVSNVPIFEIVHEAKFYSDRRAEDDYKTSSITPTQHATVENILSKAKISDAVADSLLKELAIKQDVINEKISVCDWADLNLPGTWTFAMRVPPATGEEDNRFAFATVFEDGSMAFEFDEENLFCTCANQDVIDAFYANKNCDLLVESPSGDINFIEKTDRFSIPDFNAIAEILNSGQKVSRGKDSREAFLKESTDISFAKVSETEALYYASIVGAGMQTTVPKAAILREVRAAKGSKLLFEELLPTMDVDFVRLRELTVLPFPFKHLREWVAMQKAE